MVPRQNDDAMTDRPSKQAKHRMARPNHGRRRRGARTERHLGRACLCGPKVAEVGAADVAQLMRCSASCHEGRPSAPRIVHRMNLVEPISEVSLLTSSRCGSAPAKAARVASSRHTDSVAYCLRSGRASNANPTTPSVLRNCLRTALAPRNSRHVERRLSGGMLEANTTFSRSGSSDPDHFHGDFMMVASRHRHSELRYRRSQSSDSAPRRRCRSRRAVAERRHLTMRPNDDLDAPPGRDRAAWPCPWAPGQGSVRRAYRR
jgi:hypothetical protein